MSFEFNIVEVKSVEDSDVVVGKTWQTTVYCQEITDTLDLTRVIGSVSMALEKVVDYRAKTFSDFKNCKLESFCESIDKKGTCFGIGKSQNQKLLYCVCRGSQNIGDWKANFSAIKFLSVIPGNSHLGFMNRASILPINPLFLKLKEGYRIVFSGFSQGSAVAMLWCLRLLKYVVQHDADLSGQVKFIGYAGPLVGDEDFSRFLTDTQLSKDGTTWSDIFHNFVVDGDCVPSSLAMYGKYDGEEEVKKGNKIIEKLINTGFEVGKGMFGVPSDVGGALIGVAIELGKEAVRTVKSHVNFNFWPFGKFYIMGYEETNKKVFKVFHSQDRKEVGKYLQRVASLEIKGAKFHDAGVYYSRIVPLMGKFRNIVHEFLDGDEEESEGEESQKNEQKDGNIHLIPPVLKIGYCEEMMKDRKRLKYLSKTPIIEKTFPTIRIIDTTYNECKHEIQIFVEGENLSFLNKVTFMQATEYNEKGRATMSHVGDELIEIKVRGVRKLRVVAMELRFSTIWNVYVTCEVAVRKSIGNNLPLFTMLQAALFQSLLLSSNGAVSDRAEPLCQALMNLEGLCEEGLRGLHKQMRRKVELSKLESCVNQCSTIFTWFFENGKSIDPDLFMKICHDPIGFMNDLSQEQHAVGKILRLKEDEVAHLINRIQDDNKEEFSDSSNNQDSASAAPIGSLKDLFSTWDPKPENVTASFFKGMKSLFRFSIIQSAIRFRSEHGKAGSINAYHSSGFINWIIRFGKGIFFGNMKRLECEYVIQVGVLLDILGIRQEGGKMEDLVKMEKLIYDHLLIRCEEIEEFGSLLNEPQMFKMKFLEVFKGILKQYQNRQDDIDDICLFARFLLRVYELRKQIHKTPLLFVIGHQDSGKTTLVKRVWRINPKVEFNTKDPWIYPLTERQEYRLCVVDMPALNDLDPKKKLFQTIALESAHAVVVLASIEDINKSEQMKLLKKVFRQLRIPTQLFVNKVDKKWAHVFGLEKDKKKEVVVEDVRLRLMKENIRILQEVVEQVRIVGLKKVYFTTLELANVAKDGFEEFKENVFKEKFEEYLNPLATSYGFEAVREIISRMLLQNLQELGTGDISQEVLKSSIEDSMKRIEVEDEGEDDEDNYAGMY